LLPDVPGGLERMTTTPLSLEPRLRELVSQFWKVPLERIDDELRFDAKYLKGMSSTRFLVFVAAVESNLGARLNDPSALTSYGALRRAVVGDAPVVARESSPVTSPQQSFSPSLGPEALFAIGQDIEEISSLPATDEYRSSPFYTQNFTRDEIAACTAMAEPRQHFAARWCAKEALIKCGPPFTLLKRGDIEVTNRPDGRPELGVLEPTVRDMLGGQPILVSLSHTASFASAVVLVVRQRRDRS